MKQKTTMLLAILFSCYSFGQVGTIFTSGGINYKITGAATVEVTQNPATISGAIVIPPNVSYSSKNYQVNTIGFNAFSRTNVTSVSMPTSIKTIDGYSFFNCLDLSTIAIPNSVTYIGVAAFSNCSRLNTINIPNSVTEIGMSAFANCSALTSISLPNTIKLLSGAVLRGCTSLASITIPTSVAHIHDEAFYGCISLTSISIPNSVISIGEQAFARCMAIKSIVIPNTVTSLGAQVFLDCYNLIQVSVSWATPLIIDSAVFEGLPITTMALNVPVGAETSYKKALIWMNFYLVAEPVSGSLQIGQTFTVNGNNYYVRKATAPYEAVYVVQAGLRSKDVVIPETVTNNGNLFLVTHLGVGAFDYRTDLTSVAIPNSIKSIGSFAFRDCTSLTSVTIPSTVKSIGFEAFRNCTNINFINIPNSVSSIDRSAFQNCKGLSSIFVNWLVPINISTSVFNFVTISAVTLSVPSGTEPAYKAANVWKEFNIKEVTLSKNDFVTNNTPKFYPNPAQSQINFSQEINTLEIFDIAGRKVKSFQKSIATFDVSILEKGVYILKAKTIDGKSINEKLIKE